MSRLLAFNVLCLVLIAAWAAPAEGPSVFLKIIKEHKDLLPSEVIEAYANLSGDEKAALKEVFKNYKQYKNEKELIEALKKKSPELGAKAEKLYAKLQKKVDGLSAEPKAFIQGLILAGRGLHAQAVSGEKIDKATVKSLIETQVKAFKELPAAAQTELKTTFPGVAKFLQDEKVQALIAKLLDKNNNN
uniref:Fatty-acid and retinol-binding protein 1 n=1 Tax=Caenorhabditis japonica TaxID=281687 RepID=A0A8R1DHM6_CAEJA